MDHTEINEEVVELLLESWRKQISGYQEDLEAVTVSEVMKEAEKTAIVKLFKDRIATAEAILPTIVVGADLDILEVSRDPLSAVLDKVHGDSLDPDLIRKLTRDHSQKYERRYIDDMKALGIKMPDVLTRVSEYMEEIVQMVEDIESNGYAYESNGSYYFDTVAFDVDPNHFYAKLRPNQIGKREFQEESEGNI